MMSKPLRLLVNFLIALCLISGIRLYRSAAHAQAASLPKVVLSAEALAPRPIEQRTGEAVTHDYAQAWQDLAAAFDANRTDLLSDYFTGQAKLRFTQRIKEQKNAGLHTRYQDNGHRVKAVFYSVDGGEMQLEDEAQIEVEIFDGDKMIYRSNSPQKFLVLMTPGSDRWYVRLLESVPGDAF